MPQMTDTPPPDGTPSEEQRRLQGRRAGKPGEGFLDLGEASEEQIDTSELLAKIANLRELLRVEGINQSYLVSHITLHDLPLDYLSMLEPLYPGDLSADDPEALLIALDTCRDEQERIRSAIAGLMQFAKIRNISRTELCALFAETISSFHNE